MRLTIFLIILLLAPAAAGRALADNVTIENNVSVEANTGGNSASEGEIIQGTSSVDVEVETIINGEVVEDIEIHEESTSTPVIIEKKIENIVEDATTTTNIKVELNNKDDKDDESDKNEKNFLERIFSRLLFFLADFRSFFF